MGSISKSFGVFGGATSIKEGNGKNQYSLAQSLVGAQEC